jgi:4,5-dihydroxyphthalate decarboxylase
MSGLKLKVACWNYDHARALRDGTVKFDGVDAAFESGRFVSDIFEGMVRQHAYDVSELGLTFYLRTLDLDDPPFIAIPVFPNRQFRHSAIFVNTSSGINKPRDLAGKTVGELGTYGHDAGVWPKGILSDDYGVTPGQCRWIVGGTDWPMEPFGFIPFLHPADVDVAPAPEGQTLGAMLDSGEIDALISAHVPECVMNNSPRVARLFPDYESVERDYYRRTGIYPIMHTVVIRKDLLAGHPGAARTIYRGFCDAKDVAMARYREGLREQHADLMIPWFTPLFDENRRLLPDDWWPYGVAANRKTIDTFLRYHFEQGLSKRRLTCEDIFVPELLKT